MPRSRPEAFVSLLRRFLLLFIPKNKITAEVKDSCKKQAIGTENTEIRRIPAGICRDPFFPSADAGRPRTVHQNAIPPKLPLLIFAVQQFIYFILLVLFGECCFV